MPTEFYDIPCSRLRGLCLQKSRTDRLADQSKTYLLQLCCVGFNYDTCIYIVGFHICFIKAIYIARLAEQIKIPFQLNTLNKANIISHLLISRENLISNKYLSNNITMPHCAIIVTLYNKM